MPGASTPVRTGDRRVVRNRRTTAARICSAASARSAAPTSSRRGPTTAPTPPVTATHWRACRCRGGDAVELHREPVRAAAAYPAPDPFEPFAVAAVELADEGLIVLGKVVDGTLAADLKVGMEMEADHRSRCTPTTRASSGRLRVEDRVMSPDPLYILGAGMHPWGKWGHDFTEYGVVAARAALAEAGLDWRQIQLVAGADTIRNGYPGFIAGVDVRAEAGLERRAGQLELRRLRQWIAGAAERPRADSGRVLRRGAGHRRRHHAEGLLRPGRRRTPERSRLAAVPSDRRNQPGVLRAAGAAPDGPLRRHARGFRRR